MKDQKHEIFVLEDGKVKIDVAISPSEDTVWLTQDQIAELFDVDRT